MTSEIQAETINGFDLNGSLIPTGEIKRGGPPRDGIPSIDKPQFIYEEEAKKALPHDTRAIIVEHKNVLKAYPIPILNWHEIVNDEIAGIPIVITYCPLCGTGIVFHSKFSDKILKFGVSGLLYQSDVLLYDRSTESLWSQLMRQSISGKMKGQKLSILPTKIVPLFDFLKMHPNTKILSTKTGSRRDYKRSPYGDYSSSGSLYFPVNNLDKTVHIKTWSLLIEYRNNHLIVPISELKNNMRERSFSLGNMKVKVKFDKKTSSLFCSDNVTSVTCITGFYFALKAFYPQSRVYLAQ